MIKNVIFDYGQVIIHFEPKYMTEKYIEPGEDADLLQNVVFDRLYWDRLDAGTITNEETMSLVKERLPERLHEIADRIYYNWIYNIPEIDGMADLVRELKNEHGIRVFLLSNISKYFSSHRDEIPILSEFEKCIFSAECGYIKPNHDIFEYLCKECGINKEESIFVDDNANNIKGAREFGLNGYLFDGDARRLKEYLLTVIK